MKKYFSVGILAMIFTFNVTHAYDITQSINNDVNYCKTIKNDRLFEQQMINEGKLKETISKLQKCALILPFIC